MTTNTQQIAKPEEPRAKTLATLLESNARSIADIAGKTFDVQKLFKLALLAHSRSPDLRECTPASFLQFCIRCAETGTQIIGAGGAWPVPFKNEVVFIADYRRMGNVAIEAGVITHYWSEVVYSADEIVVERGLRPNLMHKPSTSFDRGQVVGAYCCFSLPAGALDFCWMGEPELMKVKNFSKAKAGPWSGPFADEMRKKTVTRRAMKPFMGRVPQLDKLIEYDDEVTGLDLSLPEPISLPRALNNDADGEGPQDPGGDAEAYISADGDHQAVDDMKFSDLCAFFDQHPASAAQAAFDEIKLEQRLRVSLEVALRKASLEGLRTLRAVASKLQREETMLMETLGDQ